MKSCTKNKGCQLDHHRVKWYDSEVTKRFIEKLHNKAELLSNFSRRTTTSKKQK